MEGRVTRLIYTFNILTLFICSKEVTSIPYTPNKLPLIETMKRDGNITCGISTLLVHESKDKLSHIKNCSTLSYPGDTEQTVTHDNSEQFLCLAIFSSAHGICSFANAKDTVNYEKEYDSYHSKMKSLEEEDRLNTLCTDLRGLTLKYKSKHLLSNLIKSLNNTVECQSICYNLAEHKTSSLCMFLAWMNIFKQNLIKKMEQTDNIKGHETNSDDQTKSIPIKKSAPPKSKEPLKVNEQNDLNPKISNTGLNKIPMTVIHNDVSTTPIQGDQSKDIKSEPPKEESSNTINNVAITQTNSNQNLIVNSNAVNNPSKIVSSSIEPQPATIQTNNLHDVNDLPEEIRPSTISENTQDQDETNPNPEDYSQFGELLEHPGQAGNLDESKREPSDRDALPYYHNTTDDEDSHFFTYFTIISLLCIAGYLGYHNKQKILAIVLEGRRSKSNRGRRRPSTASYRKLDCTLEEAVTSQCNANVTHVIY